MVTSTLMSMSAWMHPLQSTSGTQVQSVDFFRHLFKAGKNYIGQAEVLGALAVYLSVEQLTGDLAGMLDGRRVFHFIDNQGALSNCISCSSKDDDCAWMVHKLAISAARMTCSPWFDYVRSKANIADLPSRWDFSLLQSMKAQWIPTVIPDSNAWTGVLE